MKTMLSEQMPFQLITVIQELVTMKIQRVRGISLQENTQGGDMKESGVSFNCLVVHYIPYQVTFIL